MTRFALLTAPGTSAIAALGLWGPGAWSFIRKHFKPSSKKTLPLEPVPGASWFGRLGVDLQDEVLILNNPGKSVTALEIQCHGGQLVQNLLFDLLRSEGIQEAQPEEWMREVGYDGEQPSAHALKAWKMLPEALTLRTASVLLDQTKLREYEKGSQAFAELGRHLTRPWKIAIIGPPNVGKSSLMNALAGYNRSIIAPVPGTTRDLVSVTTALEGWPVEITDTAGLRETADAIEQEGIRRSEQQLAASDLILWMLDVSTINTAEPDSLQNHKVLRLLNKIDLSPEDRRGGYLPISITSNTGLSELMRKMVDLIIPSIPESGQFVQLPD
ncbi:50S ribosome-binding GTPase [Telmatocola sphagniphila]|uniref:50S ribosome-binding GTPase n=1 Tax=Telmatocola sphagniphila TaxID=1123043 RepID=A0A8E6BA29_9BACT|nr:GTPase [Telmatocola sphagniphila]QVL33170.1 50S ribosome-binding GTPase [Telmatocola sphagniphila]